jgi:hypothetical protein
MQSLLFEVSAPTLKAEKPFKTESEEIYIFSSVNLELIHQVVPLFPDHFYPNLESFQKILPWSPNGPVCVVTTCNRVFVDLLTEHGFVTANFTIVNANFNITTLIVFCFVVFGVLKCIGDPLPLIEPMNDTRNLGLVKAIILLASWFSLVSRKKG